MQRRNGGFSLTVLLLVVLVAAPALAEEEGPLSLPGTIEGSGTVFEVTDSEYLNVWLWSSEVVYAELESIPEMVTMHIESGSEAIATEVVVGGLQPDTTYYKYEDSYENVVSFTTGGDGTYGYVQDVCVPHLVLIQPSASTLIIRDDMVGGDATLIGTWDWTTKTCTLTTDVYETIQIRGSGITLDGNGHTITGYGTGAGVYVYGVTVAGGDNVTVKNVSISGFSYGVYLYGSSYGTVADNSISNCSYAIYMRPDTTHATICGNATSNNAYAGIRGWDLAEGPYVITENTSSGDGYYGVYLADVSDCEVSFNSASSVGHGIYMARASYCTVADNVVSDSYSGGLVVHYLANSEVCRNIISESMATGLYLGISNNNDVYGNAISGSDAGGMRLMSCVGNAVHNNEISGSANFGLLISSGGDNSVYENAITGTAGHGLYLSYASNNSFYSNNFIDNTTQVFMMGSGSVGNIFNLPLPVGGNHWSDWTGPDADSDGFVDVPYAFFGGQDYLPLADPISLPPLFGNTPVGLNVTVELDGGIIVTFPEVTVAGDTTVAVSETPPHGAPTGFRFLGDYYDIVTTAEYVGPVTITIPFDPADVPGGRVDRLKLFHWVWIDEPAGLGEWQRVEIAVDTVNNVVTCEVGDLCWFALATPLYQFHGFLPPVNEDRNAPFKRGSTLPIKFQVSDELGNPVSDAVCTLTIYYLQSGAPSGEAEVVSTAAGDWGDQFRYDARDDLYIFNLSTKDASYLGYYTYQAEVTLDDGTTLSVDFSLK